MSFFRNWFYMYLKSPPAEAAAEISIARIGKPYRTQYPFPSLHRIVDFAFPREKILIEIDGASHDSPVQRRKDLTTDIAFEKMGWRVLRFTNAEALSIDITEDVIESRIRHRPTLEELERQLACLPAPPVKPPSRRRRSAQAKRVKTVTPVIAENVNPTPRGRSKGKSKSK